MNSRCSTGKICLDNESLAREELAHVRAKYGDGPGTANGYYLCDVCKCYHLTSKSSDTSLIRSIEFRERVQRLRDQLNWENRFGKI